MNNDYKAMERRLSLMHDKNWIKTISDLKKLNNTNLDNDKYDHVVTYKEQKQKNNRKFSFHETQYIEETKMFIFNKYESDYMTGKLTSVVLSRIEIYDIEIISFEKTEKVDLIDYFKQINNFT